MDKYFVFAQQRYDNIIWCVAGHDISLKDGILFLTNKEACNYAKKLNSQKETSTTSGSDGKGGISTQGLENS